MTIHPNIESYDAAGKAQALIDEFLLAPTDETDDFDREAAVARVRQELGASGVTGTQLEGALAAAGERWDDISATYFNY